MKLISIIFGLMQLGLFWTVSRDSSTRDCVGPVNSDPSKPKKLLVRIQKLVKKQQL